MGFNNVVSSSDDLFFYQRGNVTTNTPWNRPSYNKIKEYLTFVSENSDVFDVFDCYLSGGVLFNFENTWDVDIFLVGNENIDDSKIENYIDCMTDIALNEYKLLVDISWQSKRMSNYSYDDLLKCNFLQEEIIIKKPFYIKKTINDYTDEISYLDDENYSKITESLSIANVGGKMFHQKIIDKIMNNNGKTIFTFSIKDFLKNDEQYFIENTNR
jgi:hypothetical protein